MIIKKTLIVNSKNSWKIYGQHRHPLKLRLTGGGKGGYSGYPRGGPPRGVKKGEVLSV